MIVTTTFRRDCPLGVATRPEMVAKVGMLVACWIYIGSGRPATRIVPSRPKPVLAAAVKCTGPSPMIAPELIVIHGTSLTADQPQLGWLVLTVNWASPPAIGIVGGLVGVKVHELWASISMLRLAVRLIGGGWSKTKPVRLAFTRYVFGARFANMYVESAKVVVRRVIG